MNSQDCLIVFARQPRAGRVKSRLGVDLGAAQASAVYAQLLTRAIGLAAVSSFSKRFLFCADPDEQGYFESRLDSNTWSVRVQHGADIGERMDEAIRRVAAPPSACVLMGSDVADNSAHDIERARDALMNKKVDAVLGPSVDGGYWLIGLNVRAPEGLFNGIAWSSSRVCEASREALRMNKLSCLELNPRHDVDMVDDLRYLVTTPD